MQWTWAVVCVRRMLAMQRHRKDPQPDGAGCKWSQYGRRNLRWHVKKRPRDADRNAEREKHVAL